MTEGVSVSLYRYTGEPGRIFPAVPTTPNPGDVVDWRDLTPDVGCWEAAPKAKNVRPNDNGDYTAPPDVDLGPQNIEAPADPEAAPAAPSPEAAPPAETQE